MARDLPKLILFLHMQKTAGMTLQELLRRHHGPSIPERAFRRISGTSAAGLPMDQAIGKLSRRDRLFMGHFCYGIHRKLSMPADYITFFREPTARLISLYYFSNTTPGAHYYKIAREQTIEEFLLKTKLLELDNGMTRFIAGDEDDLFINRTRYGYCNEELLNQAKRNLDTFRFVGIQESFDRSVLLLSKVLNWKNPYYVTLNVRNKPGQKRIDVAEGLTKKLREINHLDMELYQYAKARFEQDYSDTFRDELPDLDQFQKSNRRYQSIFGSLVRFRMRVSKLISQ